MFKEFKNKTSKYIVLAVSILLVASLMVACDSGGSSEVVGKVNDTKITKDELYNVMVEQVGQQALDTLIAERIIELEMEKEGLEVTDKEIDEEMANLEKEYGGKEILNQALRSEGVSLETVRDNIIMNLRVKKLLASDLEVSDEEAKEFFEENKDEFVEEEQVNARHILVETKEEADEVKAKLDNGEEFGKLAKEYSNDDGTKENDGELGFFGKGQMVPEFEEVAFSLKEGEISDPVKSDYGYHIIEVHEKKEAGDANFEDLKEEIKDALIEQKLPMAYQGWYQQKLKEYDIENSLKEEPKQETTEVPTEDNNQEEQEEEDKE